MKECYICLDFFNRIPLLKCGHMVCAECYCKLKDRKINNCVICNKKLIRGCKINK